MNFFARRLNKFLPSLAIGILKPTDSKELTSLAPSQKASKMELFVQEIQDKMIEELERVDGTSKFFKDSWVKKGGMGYGVSGVLQDSRVFEKVLNVDLYGYVQS